MPLFRFPAPVAAALLADRFQRDEAIDWKLELAARKAQEAEAQAEVQSCQESVTAAQQDLDAAIEKLQELREAQEAERQVRGGWEFGSMVQVLHTCMLGLPLRWVACRYLNFA